MDITMPRRQYYLLATIAVALLTTLFFLAMERTASPSSSHDPAPDSRLPFEEAMASSDDGVLVLRLVAPRGVYLFGKQQVQLAPTLSSSDQIKTVDFFVDGVLRKTLAEPPFALEVDFGEEIRSHSILITAQTREGRAAKLSWISRSANLQSRAEVSLVTLSVTVLGRDGRAVEGLGMSDFSLLEDGVPQALVHFDRDPTPASIAVALDASESMRGTLWSAQKAANDFIASLPSFYKVCVIGFSDTVRVAREFSYDRRGLAYAVSSLKPAGETALYDTLRSASEQLSARSDRRIVVLFTDGGESLYSDDPKGRQRLSSSLLAAREAGVTFYTIAFGAHAATELLQRIAEETGGAFYDSRDPSALTSIFAEIAESVNHQYTLSYYPTHLLSEGGWRSVSVSVKRDGVTLRARPGYLAATPGPAAVPGQPPVR
ncbi:MAG TPA: VWA domain-containing protein [Candidatus Polarisedimenticolia bacterium]|nr:VWA domain-containing protein [Candidatus Polarisedimenticolia bacterium]